MGTNTMYVHCMEYYMQATWACICAVKGGSTENQSYGNSTCTESCQRNIVFTRCVHVHKSVRVTVRACSHTLCEL